jgi:hypothetical protein
VKFKHLATYLSPKRATDIIEKRQNLHISHLGGQGVEELTDTSTEAKQAKVQRGLKSV